MSYSIELKQFLLKPIRLLRIEGEDTNMAQPTHAERLEAIAKAIEGIEFGEVQITIQDGVIVQINRVEKQRFQQQRKTQK